MGHQGLAVDELNVAGPDSLVVPSEYLEILIDKA
jgi:hypothetical protein